MVYNNSRFDFLLSVCVLCVKREGGGVLPYVVVFLQKAADSVLIYHATQQPEDKLKVLLPKGTEKSGPRSILTHCSSVTFIEDTCFWTDDRKLNPMYVRVQSYKPNWIFHEISISSQGEGSIIQWFEKTSMAMPIMNILISIYQYKYCYRSIIITNDGCR